MCATSPPQLTYSIQFKCLGSTCVHSSGEPFICAPLWQALHYEKSWVDHGLRPITSNPGISVL